MRRRCGNVADELQERFKAMVCEILEIDPKTVAREEQFNQLLPTIDSVAMLEILVTLERTYNIHITEDEIQALREWRQLLELVRQKISDRKSEL